MVPDFFNEIVQAKLPQAIQSFQRMQQASLGLLQEIKDALQPVTRIEPLPLDFNVPVGVAPVDGYQTTVNLSITKIMLATTAAGTFTVFFGENSPWLLAYPIAANIPVIIDLEGDLARMIGRGVRIQVTFSAGVGHAHMWARTS